jgi:hypothetical protein
MKKLIFSAAVLAATATTAVADIGDVAKFIKDKYDSEMILPFGEKSVRGAKQVGAVYTGLKYQKFGSQRAFKWKTTYPYCANAPDKFLAEGEIATSDFVWKVEAGLTIKAAIKDVFELLSFEAEYLDTIKVNLKDVRSTVPPPNLLVNEILKVNWADDEFCRPQIFCGPTPTFIVTGVTEAKVDVEVYFKAGVKLSIANLTFNKIGATLGLEAKAGVEEGGGPDKPWKLTSEGKHVVIGFNLTPWRQLMSRANYACR